MTDKAKEKTAEKKPVELSEAQADQVSGGAKKSVYDSSRGGVKFE